MSTYKITSYSKKEAKLLDVKIKPSTNPKKKIDVFDKDGKKLCSIGDVAYGDFPTYDKINEADAHERRRLYHIRHAKDEKVIGSPSYFASKILW